VYGKFCSQIQYLHRKGKREKLTLGEIHTGSLWESARLRYCGDDPDAFPLALLCFYDKANTDVFDSLSCATFICTPSFLKKDCCNYESNYMVLGYISNLGNGKGKAKKLTAEMKLQVKHNCLSLITNQIIKIHDKGGFWTEVMGRCVWVIRRLLCTLLGSATWSLSLEQQPDLPA
jgi:hypothetical protein